MLVDSSSTYNFIDEFTTRKVGCHMSGSPPMSVVVIDRNRILCNQMCVGLVWKMVGQEFKKDLRPNTMGFSTTKDGICFNQKKIVLRQLPLTILQLMQGKTLVKALQLPPQLYSYSYALSKQYKTLISILVQKVRIKSILNRRSNWNNCCWNMKTCSMKIRNYLQSKAIITELYYMKELILLMWGHTNIPHSKEYHGRVDSINARQRYHQT